MNAYVRSGYLAPECFKGKTQVKYGHSYRLDIYSLGVVITDILTKGKEYQIVDNVRVN
jgi:serine/threonine protein kinase